MNFVGTLVRKLKNFFGRKEFDSELREEMAFHREERARVLHAQGLGPEQARCAANREFGNATYFAEHSREVIELWF